MAEANLIVTFDPTHEESSKKVIEAVLGEIKEKGKILKTSEGVAEVSVSDARKVVKALIPLAKKDKEKFGHTFHWIPIDKWCKSVIADMQKTIKEATKNIAKTERWKMDLAKRKYEAEKDLIIKLTDVIDNTNVDLKEPQKIIEVQIIEKKAGISVLKPDEVLNVAKI